MSTAVLAAAEQINFKPAGWVALFIILALCVGLYFLMRSMSHQMKKVDFDESATERPRPSAEEPRDDA
ncbi:hypothetical protein KV102_11165 [Mumia sp. zg.B53]|uniref:hypothetical protein n=1 Tax=unclassified Mumia TaxID=2621872 RepID=UPI001C6F2F12|nr:MULTISPECIES: hypothetical protein [unclassified Mumia]MBW9210835.1 hypothetical protein [Mumia sp. zg.B21]MBW9215400.1 hypothetical protein [Mumia sp. zg.B53]